MKWNRNRPGFAQAPWLILCAQAQANPGPRAPDSGLDGLESVLLAFPMAFSKRNGDPKAAA